MLKQCGIYIDIISLKVLLRELGFSWNGASTSFTQLYIACRAFLHGQVGGGFCGSSALRSVASQSVFSGLPGDGNVTDPFPGQENRPRAKRVIFDLRDLFYSTGKNLFELYKMGNPNAKTLDLDQFTNIVNECSDGHFNTSDIETVFMYMCHSLGGAMSFDVFEKNFRSEVPTGVEFETVVVRKVRSWMYKNRLSSEMAFDAFCRSTGNFVERLLSRPAFHEAFQQNEIHLAAAQIDALFNVLTGGQTETMTLKHWQSRIYEDGDNPLQMMREVTQGLNLT